MSLDFFLFLIICMSLKKKRSSSKEKFFFKEKVFISVNTILWSLGYWCNPSHQKQSGEIQWKLTTTQRKELWAQFPTFLKTRRSRTSTRSSEKSSLILQRRKPDTTTEATVAQALKVWKASKEHWQLPATPEHKTGLCHLNRLRLGMFSCNAL